MSCSNDCNCGSCCPGPKGDKGENGNQGGQGIPGIQGQEGLQGSAGGIGAAGNDGIDGFGYNSSTADSIDVLDTPALTVAFTIDSEKAYTSGARVRVSEVGAPTVNYFEGVVTIYSDVTGAITVSSIDFKSGAGTHIAWNINLAGEIGNTGVAGSQGIQGPAGLQGIQGIQGVQGIQGASGIDLYDSGWKELNDYTIGQGFGVAPISNWTNPSIRIIGRNAYINGTFLIPLADNGDSTSLRGDFTTYATTHKVDTQTYTDTDGGFVLNVNGSAISQAPIIPVELSPVLALTAFNRMDIVQRFVQDTAGVNNLTLNTMFNPVYLYPSGKIQFISHKDVDDSSGPSVPNSNIHSLITKATAGEYVLDFGAYKTSFTGTGPGTDNRVVTAHPTSTYPATVDGEDETKWGGYYFTIDISYPLSIALTENQIRNAFDSI